LKVSITALYTPFFLEVNIKTKDCMAILIISEHDNQQLKTATLATISAAKALTQDITVLVVGFQCQPVVEQASKIEGVKALFVADAEVYRHQLPENVAELIATLASQFAYILAPASAFGKNLLPRVAALLDVAQISDITAIVSFDTFVRPIYAGNAFATVQSTDPIKVLSIRPSAFPPASIQDETVASVTKLDTIIENTASQWVSMTSSAEGLPDLTSAQIVISGGRGLQSAENFKLLEKIAYLLGAAIGASRAAVDAGFAPNDWQVGQTGKVVAPNLYIAVGISGAIQHLAGMKESKVIVAINQDADAAIFQVADYGLVGDLFKILPELETAIKHLN
jgi:electron transfer flavoprotein alpha subunit